MLLTLLVPVHGLLAWEVTGSLARAIGCVAEGV